MTTPVKFSPSERDRRPPFELLKTEELIAVEREPVEGDVIDEEDGLVGEDNPPMRWVYRSRPRRR